MLECELALNWPIFSTGTERARFILSKVKRQSKRQAVELSRAEQLASWKSASKNNSNLTFATQANLRSPHSKLACVRARIIIITIIDNNSALAIHCFRAQCFVLALKRPHLPLAGRAASWLLPVRPLAAPPVPLNTQTLSQATIFVCRRQQVYFTAPIGLRRVSCQTISSYFVA